MAYNTKLADRIREAFQLAKEVKEKNMFSGLGFLVDGKLCIFVVEDELLCRIGAAEVEKVVEQNGVRQFINNRKVMKDYVYVSEHAFLHQRDFDRWIKLSLAFNPQAKASRR